MPKGINKHNIKLEDYNDYAAYRKAFKNAANRATYKKHGKAYHYAYYHTPKGKAANLKACAKYYNKKKAANYTGFKAQGAWKDLYGAIKSIF